MEFDILITGDTLIDVGDAFCFANISINSFIDDFDKSEISFIFLFASFIDLFDKLEISFIFLLASLDNIFNESLEISDNFLIFLLASLDNIFNESLDTFDNFLIY